MIKKIQIESSLFTILLISILFTYKFDIWILGLFSQLDFIHDSNSLRKFFVDITVLGDSLWYFSTFILIFLFSYLAKMSKIITLEKYSYLKKFSIFGFIYLLLVGVITQIIKHLVGRPRPNHSLLDGSFEFNFFTTESAFHSFPSGHSSTIVAIVLIVSLTLPSLKYFFYFFGFLIALSRVVVEAHFITDVVGGALVAVIIYKIFNFFIKTKHPNMYWDNLRINKISILTKTLIIFLIIAIFITFGPKIDIFISSLFYHGNNQFFIQSYYFTSILFRKILLPLLLMYIFVLPIILKFIPLEKIYLGYKFSLSEIIFVWFSGIFTLLFVVNVLLKNMWGRVRPNDILSFGGYEGFTPWFKISNLCTSNCSFVSGDASVGFFLIIFYFITKKNIYCYLGIVLGSLLGVIRIMAGGHFFSDIIFSQIVVTVSVLMSFILYKKLYDK